MGRGPSILIVRFGSLGDVILTTPLLRAIRAGHPDARITYVTKRAYAPVLASSPRVDRVVALEPGESVRSLTHRLRGEGYDHRLDLHASLRSLALRALLGGPWGTWPKRRVRRALALRGRGKRSAPVQPLPERYFAAARGLGVTPDGGPAEFWTTPEDEARARALVGSDGYVALCPGARHWNKRWPPAHWTALAGLLSAQGRVVVGIGTAGERALLEAPGVLDGFGTSLGVAAALLRRARVAAANDSGLMHLATAVGTPVVALFGPTSPALGYAPYRAPAVVLERGLPCRPCSAYGGPHCPLGHHQCMIGIDPAGVAAAVRSLA